MLRSHSRQIYQNLWETLASVFLGSPRWGQCAGVLENHCFSLSITSLSYLNKELSQMSTGGKWRGQKHKEKKSGPCSWANPQLKAGPEIGEICYLQAPATPQCPAPGTGPKMWTTWHLSQSQQVFSLNQVMGTVYQTEVSQGGYPCRWQGLNTLNLSASVATNIGAYKCNKLASAKKKVG